MKKQWILKHMFSRNVKINLQSDAISPSRQEESHKKMKKKDERAKCRSLKWIVNSMNKMGINGRGNIYSCNTSVASRSPLARIRASAISTSPITHEAISKLISCQQMNRNEEKHTHYYVTKSNKIRCCVLIHSNLLSKWLQSLRSA